MNKFIAIFLLCISIVSAQTSVQNAILNWNDTQNPTGTVYAVYRAPGACDASPVFVVKATGLTNKTYTDANVQPGTYCYKVTGTAPAQVESPGVTGNFVAPTFNPTGLSITLQLQVQIP